jgi:hypothetical protein
MSADPERRVGQATPDKGSLSLAQDFSVNGLTNYGYRLLFVRYINGSAQALLEGDNGVASVDDEGEVDVNPDIAIR